MEELIKAIQDSGNDGAILFKLNDKNEITHISPILRVDNITDMVKQLEMVRNAVEHFMHEIVDKQLPKN